MSDHFETFVAHIMSDDDSELGKIRAERDYALHCLEREISIAQSAQSEIEHLQSQLAEAYRHCDVQAEAIRGLNMQLAAGEAGMSDLNEPRCPFCGRDPFHYVDNGLGMEAVAVTCCDLGNMYFRGMRPEPEDVTLSWEDFTTIGHHLVLRTQKADEIEFLPRYRDDDTGMQPHESGEWLRREDVLKALGGGK